MQDLMNMNFGGGNRGFGGPPQPQRPNNRRNRGGGGQGGFRNTRFDQNRGPQQSNNNRPNDVNQPQEQAKPPTPAAPAKAAADITPKPEVTSQTPSQPPAQNQPPKPPNNKTEQSNVPQQQNQTANNRNPTNFTQDNRNANDNKNKNFGGPGNKQGGNFNNQGSNFNNQNKQQGGNYGQGNRQGGNFNAGNKQQGGGGGPGGVQGGQGGQQNGQPRNQRQGRGPGDKMANMPHAHREEHMLASKLKELTGPLVDLPPLEQTEVKFNGRSRLYIGNLSNEITEEELQEMFSAYGETSEFFLNKEKNFAFIRMDYRANAEKAKHELDGSVRRGRPLRVRFAPHNSAVRVRNLTGFVTNELLHRAFEIFGKIERAYVKVDERGKSLNEGVVEYARKPSALAAIRNCTEKCYFLTSSLRPVIVESFEEPDEFDGYQEKNLPKKHPDYLRARELGPRFSELNSFEHEYGTRWKQLHELYKQKEEALKNERTSEEDKLEAQMEYAKYEHETELLREQLRAREQDRERQKRTYEMVERQAEERREAERVALARQEEQLASRMRQQDDDLRRRQQENTLFMQAQRLNNMLDRQEQGMFESQPQNMDGGFMEQQYQDRGRSFDDMRAPAQHWEGMRHHDDFPNKRRRF